MISLAILTAALAAAGPTIGNNRVPGADLVSNLENAIVMPKGAEALASYARSYTEADIAGKDMIIGQLVDRHMAEEFAKNQHQPAPPPVRRVFMNEIVPTFDGGCGIVMVVYEVAGTRPPRVVCNPEGPR